jgi:osmoprotectant transport system ATP-binding protein
VTPPDQKESDPVIKLDHVSKSYDHGRTVAVEDLSLDVATGEFVTLVGESGSGKTTSLKFINRLVEPDQGTVFFEGSDTAHLRGPDLRRRMGYVIQGVGLFPHLSVAHNVGVVMRLLGWSPEKMQSRTDQMLELVGLSPGEFRNRRPAELSGGQQQRVGVARALAAGPGVMLMDEPFGALDPITRESLQEEFVALKERLNLTVVMVTHDMSEALLMADRIAIMASGRLIRVDTPQNLLREPGHAYVEELLSKPMHQVERLNDLRRGAKDQ